MMPSSIHEVIITPYDDETDLDEFSCMVQETNDEGIVKPHDRLANRAYPIDLSKIQDIASMFKP